MAKKNRWTYSLRWYTLAQEVLVWINNNDSDIVAELDEFISVLINSFFSNSL